MSGASGRQRADLNAIRNLEIPTPPLTTQRKIAAILSAYDDLIENNTRRIRILEEMAQMIYREWFVNFRFPGHENVKMVESELGLIPEEWEVKRLGKVIEIAKGKKANALYEIPHSGTIPYLLIEGLKNGKYVYTDDTSVTVSKEDDVIMVMDGASSGTVFIEASGAVGSTLAVFRPKDPRLLSPYVLFLFLQQQNEEIRRNNIGSAIPHANKSFINSMEFALPPPNLGDVIHGMLNPLFLQIKNLKTKSDVLRRTRDLLLPKLVSGEVDVSELDIDTEGLGNA